MRVFIRGLFLCLILSCSLFGQISGYNQPNLFTLKNGLKVIVYEDDSLPVVSVVLGYGVGSRQDPDDKAGLAFLMQHLMFQGSKNVSPMQHINYIQNTGGELNAATTFDKTYFYETVPANQLGLILWLESDRMASLDISEVTVNRIKEMLINNENQRRIQEPYARYFFLVDEILFPDYSYGHALTGTPDSVDRITVEDVLAFYRKYYVPNNAVLSISGDVKVAKVKELVTRYFETISRAPEFESQASVDFRSIFSSRDQVMFDSLISIPALEFGLRFDEVKKDDYLLFRLLEYILINGKRSRLYNRLVNKERIAFFLSGGLEDRGEYLSLKIFLTANNQVMIDRAKKIISEEFTRLKTEMISEKELLRAKTKYKMDYYSQLTGSNLSRALSLTEFYLRDGNLPDINKELASLSRVNTYSILSLARKYLKDENYCFISILPR
ncbi:MAG: insulinase family protein [Candidatus Aminicenantes bacterium]|nr:insulinase family protein [Candidatus Aminicenantes bacterium]